MDKWVACSGDKQEEVLSISDNNKDTTYIDVCSTHNKEYIKICKNDNLYCELCPCPLYVSTINEWRNQALIQMQKFEDKLNNKIKGLNCIIEMSNNNKSVIKEI